MFFRHAFDIFKGALIGQLIPIALMPIILRLYTPEEYGVFGSIMSLALIFSTFAMLQLEVAVVLPAEDEQADTMAKTALQTGLVMTVAVTILAAAAYAFLSGMEAFGHISAWIMVAPLLGLTQACVWLGNYVSVRHRFFKDIGNSVACLHTVNGPLAIGLGVLKSGTAGLVLSRLAGQITAVVMYRQAFARMANLYRREGPATRAQMAGILQAFRKFPLYSTPYVFLSTVAREAASIILIAFNHAQAAGFYTIVRMILLMPSGLLSTSVGQVFYKEASRSLHKPEFRNFTYALILGIITVMAPGCAYIAEWGPQLFAIVFGQQWAGAGIYALLLMPLSLVFTINTWLGRVFEITNRQDELFRMQMLFDGISVAALVGGLVSGWPAIEAITGYVICQTVYFLTYLAVAFRIIHLPLRKYILLIGVGIALAAVVFALHAVIEHAVSGFWVRFAAETALVGGICLGFLVHTVRKIHKNPLFLEGTGTS